MTVIGYFVVGFIALLSATVFYSYEYDAQEEGYHDLTAILFFIANMAVWAFMIAKLALHSVG